jgi:hypothetical protein
VAWQAYNKANGVKYIVENKFKDDHLVKDANLSKQTSINAALARYAKNQRIVASSWLLMTDDMLKNKASGAQKVPITYNGAQQMAVAIKVKRRTVTIVPLDDKQRARIQSYQVKVGNEIRHVSCASEEKEVVLAVKGEWKPVSGEVKLYHYDEAALPNAPHFIDAYLVWNTSGDGKPTTPKATK